MVSFFERFRYSIPNQAVNSCRWPGVGKIVVPESSATLGYPGESRAGLDGNHLTIAKYRSNQDPNFVTVATALHELVDIVAAPSQPILGYIPFRV